jgi:hypothetical protein
VQGTPTVLPARRHMTSRRSATLTLWIKVGWITCTKVIQLGTDAAVSPITRWLLGHQRKPQPRTRERRGANTPTLTTRLCATMATLSSATRPPTNGGSAHAAGPGHRHTVRDVLRSGGCCGSLTSAGQLPAGES